MGLELSVHRRPLLPQGLRDSEPEDFLKLLIDPNEVYCSEASAGSDSGISEDPGRPDSPPAPQAPSSPALYEVVYEAGALERAQGGAGPAIGFISLQLGQCSGWKGDSGPSAPALPGARGFPSPSLQPGPAASRVYPSCPVSPSGQRSPQLLVPDACVVCELPPDAQADSLPTAGSVRPVPPAAPVSLGPA